jgi:hypothetical protein
MNVLLRIVIVASVAAQLVGCSTPVPVLDLAEKTAANAGILSTRMHQLAAESDSLFVNRVHNIEALISGVAEQRAAFDLDVLLTRRAGQQADLEMLDNIRRRRVETDAITAARGADAALERRKALLDAQVKHDTRTEALHSVAEKLTVLAKESSTEERAKLFTQFARAVRDDVRKQLDDGSAASKAAKELIDELKSDLKAATKKDETKP